MARHTLGQRGLVRAVGTLAAGLLVAGLVFTKVAKATDGQSDTTVERLVAAAQQADVDGDVALRFALLRQAVRIAPDYQLARSQLGQVKVDGEWLAIEEAQRRAAADPKQATYRELREECGESPAGQLELARWCRRNDLDDESQFHWSSVLSVDPNHKEALRVLKMHWHDGQLLSRDQIRQEKQVMIGTRRASRQWTSAVTRWERALSAKHEVLPSALLDEIRGVDDVSAIPSFEIVTLDTAQVRGGQNEGRRLLSTAFIDALDAMSDHPATQSLVRHAVLSQFPDVRYDAADRLRKRPKHDVVPLLLDGMSARIESSFRVVVDNAGGVHYLHSMYREGPFADWSHQEAHSIHQQASPGRIAADLMGDAIQRPVEIAAADVRTDAVSVAAANRSARRYEGDAAIAEQQITQTNEQATALNERIVSVLTRVTDQNLGTEPRPWWDWWQGYNEYDQSEERPLYQTADVTNEYIIPDIPKECFARGTPVWTKTGQRPIESLGLGDLVLAQNVDTGELSYKPVIGRTVRPPSETVNISLRGETLRTTRGHPFWVSGIGWRMAKELEEGAILHGVTGVSRIVAVSPSVPEEAYNLVVADFNSYFVGEHGVLVHDNSPRKPTRAKVPGLVTK